MFESIQNLLSAIFSNVFSLGATLFAIGILICAIMAAWGGEEGKQKFQKGLVVCACGFTIFLLANPLITFIQQNT
jgi:stage V sporulation protein AE